MKMRQLQDSDVARRAWNILRLVLLWARKGSVFKRRLRMDVRVVSKFIKNIGQNKPPTQIHYLERELSFDKTPIFHVKMRRPSSMRFNIPCITPKVDFDEEDQHDGGVAYGYEYYSDAGGRKSGGEDQEEVYEEKIVAEEEGIDLRAEEFIANFYKQMKLQRQMSYLQHHDDKS